MTVIIADNKMVLADKITTVEFKYEKHWTKPNSTDAKVVEVINEESKLVILEDHPVYDLIGFTGITSKLSNLLSTKIIDSKLTAEDAHYKIMDIYSLISRQSDFDIVCFTKDNNRATCVGLNGSSLKTASYLTEPKHNTLCWGSGESELSTYLYRENLRLNPLELMVLLQSLCPGYGTSFDYYNRVTKKLEKGVSLTKEQRRKYHRSAMKKISEMPLIHPLAGKKVVE